MAYRPTLASKGMATEVKSWRARQREETLDQICWIALRLLSEGGAAALSLRSIAREMGMTAAALYTYYRDRDELITTLIRRIYGDLAERLEQARDSKPPRDRAARAMEVAESYRQWAITHPTEFQLVYGSPIPGYLPPAHGAAPVEEHRACSVLIDLVAGVGARPSTRATRWADFEPAFATAARASHPRLTAPELALAQRLWARMHGLVALEVYGQLTPQLKEREKHYRAEMREFADTL